jgi:hypothetical protein
MNEQEKPLRSSKKFRYVLLVLGSFLALELGDLVQIDGDAAVLFLLGVLGAALGTHTATNIAAMRLPDSKPEEGDRENP